MISLFILVSDLQQSVLGESTFLQWLVRQSVWVSVFTV